MNKIGLLAGTGSLPVVFARAARGMGFTVVAIGVVDEIDSELQNIVNELHLINIGSLDMIFEIFRKAKIKSVTMLGKVTKELLFSDTVILDNRAQNILEKLENRSDDSIMLAFVQEFEKEGIKIFDQTTFISSLIPKPGLLTKCNPSDKELADMEFGFKMAKGIGILDIGQTVVVKNLAVLAVEAIEGTDACIARGGMLGGNGVIIAKVAKPKQDVRFDMPSIGPDTIKAMVKAGATALVVEAGKTLLISMKEVIKLADLNNISIVAK